MGKIGGYIRLSLPWSTKAREIVLIIWTKGSRTPIHDHSPSGGKVRVLWGCLWEQRFSPETKKKVGKLTYHCRGKSMKETAAHVHATGYNGWGIALSLHVYAPALTMKVFPDEDFET
jgi:cysteine dioxygenase type I